MQVSAKLKNLRVSSRKVRLVTDMIKGDKVENAKVKLQFSTKKTSEDVLGLLDSAISNAKNNFSLDENNLYVSSIFVNDGPVLKRWRPRAMGRASAIRKRTCTIHIVLDEVVEKKEEKAPKKKTQEKSAGKEEKKVTEKKTKEKEIKEEKPKAETKIKKESKKEEKKTK